MFYITVLRMYRFIIILCLLLSAGCTTQPKKPLSPEPMAITLLADIQYGDEPVKGLLHYRAAQRKLAEAVADLNQQDLDFAVQVGDLLDGYPEDPNRSLQDFETIFPILQGLTVPCYHVVGNHCITVGRETLLQRLGLKRAYYDFTHPALPGWRCVVVDGTEAGNGQIGPIQLAWLRATLTRAAAQREQVLCFCHFAVAPEAARHGMTDPEPILEVLDETGCVRAWFAGHDHGGGYAERRGVHHVTLHGMIETASETSYAVLEISPNELRLKGVGREPNCLLPLP
ncbi:metallophosphoesterase [Planctomycetota bacterium]